MSVIKVGFYGPIAVKQMSLRLAATLEMY